MKKKNLILLKLVIYFATLNLFRKRVVKLVIFGVAHNYLYKYIKGYSTQPELNNEAVFPLKHAHPNYI